MYHYNGIGEPTLISDTDIPIRAARGPSTYLNGAVQFDKNSNVGWPYDHSVEDTFDIPHGYPVSEPAKLNANTEGSCFPEGAQHDLSELKARSAFFTRMVTTDTPQYTAEFEGNGGAVLVLYTPAKIIARFETFSDAETAAKALNEHHVF